MDLQTLKKIYASLEVLRNIGVEPNEAQLVRLGQIEEEFLQQATNAFVDDINVVRRPFMFQLDYEPDKSYVTTIVVDDIVLPDPLPMVKQEEKASEQHQNDLPVETASTNQIVVPETAEYVKNISHIETQIEVAPKAEPQLVELVKSNPADDFFSSLYDTPAEDSRMKRTRQNYSLNGSGFMKKEDLVFEIIKLYVRHHPKATFNELRQVFSDDYCANRFKSIGFLVSEDDLEDWNYNGKYNFYHGNDPKRRFLSADNIGFYHYASWTHESLMPILDLAKSFGYRITTDKDE